MGNYYYENKHVIRHGQHIAVVLKEKDMQVLKPSNYTPQTTHHSLRV